MPLTRKYLTLQHAHLMILLFSFHATLESSKRDERIVPRNTNTQNTLFLHLELRIICTQWFISRSRVSSHIERENARAKRAMLSRPGTNK